MSQTPSSGSRRASQSRRERFSVPLKDVSVCEWIDAQENLSASLRTVVRLYIKENGITDVMCDPIKPVRKHRATRHDGGDERSWHDDAIVDQSRSVVDDEMRDDHESERDEEILPRVQPMEPIGYDMSRQAGRYVEPVVSRITDEHDDDDDDDVNNVMSTLR